jgi:hypothetical protein
MRPLFKTIIIALFVTGFSYISCKSKPTESNNTSTNVDTATKTNVDTSTTTVAPVQISPDDSLKTGVQDATKDYPDVTATVDNGEITLTGTITREKLPKLMMALNSLHPKKINNNLTIKK